MESLTERLLFIIAWILLASRMEDDFKTITEAKWGFYLPWGLAPLIVGFWVWVLKHS